MLQDISKVPNVPNVPTVPNVPKSDPRWVAVLARDHRADGTFIYAVTSTGVFCRPSCPSRRPRQDRVRYFPTPAAAEQAGFRACRRCRPTEPVDANVAAPIQRAAAFLAAHVDEAVPLERLAKIARLSPSHFQRRFTRALGVSPREYQSAIRAERFRRELRSGRDVTSAIYEAGYGSPSRVYEGTPTGRGMAPSTYRRGGAGLEIGYTIVPSPLGRLLVAATPAGVCAVKLGDTNKALEEDLRREFPSAAIARDMIVAPAWVSAIVDQLRGSQAALELPLDVRGTAFQWRVWRALQQIPLGETRSYSDIAAAIDRPRAVRAVARACATNPVCIVVPCHRVLPKTGAAGGYRWGTARKQRLLAIEAHSTRVPSLRARRKQKAK
jgi:AraC family transcriptional regulator, regulatory protein of adaptative response / methylated-DNA-[protein]-cysteine methyltransferase